MKTPVLLIAFNRPDTLKQVFDSVRKAEPPVLYVAIDGPRNEQDRKSGEACRAIVSKVDWSCEVHTCFRTRNLGCGYGPAEAITWAFENEDRLIVLEDDCVPSQSFFRFCDEMLERYKDDERVEIISGRSHHAGTKFFEKQDYLFTHYAHTWGWATWKRCWREFDIKMKDYSQFIQNGGFKNVLFSDDEVNHFEKWLTNIYNHIEEECTHSWDAQWVYARLKSGALGIVPAQNLIQNVGEMGTHAHGHYKTFELEAKELPEVIRHPQFVLVNREYDEMHFHNQIHVVIPLNKRIFHRLLRWIK